jgi:tetratricopeptide (TPR) repeat protein
MKDNGDTGTLMSVLYPALIAVVAGIVYSNTIGHDFVFDDIENILNNPVVNRSNSLWQSVKSLDQPWRPVTQFSYALSFFFFGFNPKIFHLTNILMHMINSVLVFGIARNAATLWPSGRKPELLALAAGVIHATHPLYSQAVSYVWGRSSSLCAMFYFGAIFLTMQGDVQSGRKKPLLYGCAALSGFLAWKTKEEAITLGLIIAVYFALRGAWRLAAGLSVLPVLLVAARHFDIGNLYQQVARNSALAAAGLEPALDPISYFLTHLKVSIFYYLKLFVFPVNLNADPYIEATKKLTDPLLITSLAVLATLVTCAVVLAKRKPLLSFALAALLISPLMTYALMPLADVAAEHRVYISGLGFDLLAAFLLTLSARHAYSIVAGVSLILGILTVQRNQVWKNGLTLWKDAEEKSPGLARPHLNLGFAYQSAGQTDAALAEYRHSLSVNPRLAPAYINMSAIYFSRNELDRSEAALRKAVALSPSMFAPYINLAIIALRKNHPEEALEMISKAAAIEDSYLVYLNRADILCTMGRLPEALRDYQKALDLRPDLSELRAEVDGRLRRLKESGAIQ